MLCLPGRIVITVLVVSLALVGPGCDSGSSGGGDDVDDFDRAAMLENLADNVIVPAYADARSSVEALEAAIAAFESDPTIAGLAGVRSALKTARIAWQRVNMFQFGPAESTALKASVNTYPVDTARIESNIDSGSWTLGTIDNRAAAGFPAIGYLVHPIETADEDVVAAFTSGTHASDRMAYLVDNAAFVRGAIESTADAWTPGAGGAFRSEFLSASNSGTDVGSSLGMLANALVLHIERFLRDGKIGIPAGVRSAGVPRPTSTEAFYGGYSTELAIANTFALKRTVFGTSTAGTPGPGLDDHLEALGAGELSDEIKSAFDEAIAALEELDDPLSTQIASDVDPVLTTFTELQDVVVLLKADMTSILGVTITFQDNDGD